MQSLKHFIAIAALLVPCMHSMAEPVNDQSRIAAAANQLVRSQLDSGFFSYDFDFSSGYQTDMSVIEAHNLVRQAGAAFSLGEYLARQDKEAVRAALKLFLQKVEAESVAISKGRSQEFLEATGLYDRWQLWGLLREPLLDMGLLYQAHGEAKLVSVDDNYDIARPGGTALSLLAALRYREVTEDQRFDQIIRQWKDGLLVLRVSGRGVRKSPDQLGESAYDNAESWYALAAYSRAFPDDLSAYEALQELDTYLIKQYGENFNVQFHHWGTMAAAVRFETTKDIRFKSFMDTLTAMFLELVGHAFPETNSCAAIEGLATYMGTLSSEDSGSPNNKGAAREFIYRAMAVNRRLQIDEETGRKFSINPAYNSQLLAYRGAFLKSQKEPLMQVDLTQHCLNALLRMESAGVAR